MILFISIVISFSFDLEFDFKHLEKQTTNVTQHIDSIQNNLYFCKKKQDHTRNLLALLLCTFTSVKVAQVIILLSCISFNVGQKYTKIYSRKRCNSVFCNAQSKRDRCRSGCFKKAISLEIKDQHIGQYVIRPVNQTLVN